ncbi:hypothetical protein OsJ_32035 [Oryza sativa Japonica Group]|uniref:K Homology domain-containing protein n=1 Tax=Oryza sativa subsp. japonica TaxID=39947 RepID=B9G6G6_ORYSJ|nr:hypothetical protein OsJ_32035 [Oryza sativa Japonica Group]
MARRAASRAVGALRSDGSIQGRGGRAGGSGAEDARHVFDELLRRGRGASIYGLNRALADVARHSPAAAVSRYNRMARAGADEVTPDLCTYGILIGCCCRAGRLDLGFAALGNVIKKGFRVEAITFTPLLKGLCADKRTSDAMDIVLRRMTELGCIPNVFSYNNLLNGLCDENRSQEALELLHMMADDRGGGSPPDVVSYTTVINGFFKEGDSDKAYSTYHEMLDRGILPDVVTYSSIIAALCKGQAMDKPWSHCKEGRVIESEKLFDLMVRIGVKPDIITYSTLIDGYCLAGKMDEAMKLLSGMVSVGLKPNTVTYSTLINGYCKISRMEDALVLFKEMESSGVSPDIITYNIILQGLFQTRRTAAAKELYVRITESGTQIELSTYNIILHGLCKNKLTDDALQMFQNLCLMDLKLEARTFNIMIDALLKVGRNDEAKDLFVAFSSNGLVPNYWTYRLMAENIIGQGLLEELDQLFLSMEDNGCTVDSGMLNFIVRELLQRALKFCVGILFSYSPIRGGIFSVCVNSEVQTGACGQVKEVGKNASEERLIVVSSQEIPDDPVSPTIEALILLHSKASTLAENHQLTTRLVVPSNKVGCILGEGGKVITEMRRRTGAEIRVYSKADKPKYLSFDEELVQASVFSFTLGLQNLRTGPAHDPYTVYPVEYFSKREYPSGSSKVAPSASYERYAATTRLPNGELPSSISPGADYMSCRSYLDQVPTDRYSNRVTLQLGLSRAGNSNVQQLGITRAGNSNAYDYTEAAEQIHGREDYRRLSGLTGYPGGSSNCGFQIVNWSLSLVLVISGARVKLHEAHPGSSESIVEIQGIPDQVKAAQSLLQGFIGASSNSRQAPQSSRMAHYF